MWIEQYSTRQCKSMYTALALRSYSKLFLQFATLALFIKKNQFSFIFYMAHPHIPAQQFFGKCWVVQLRDCH